MAKCLYFSLLSGDSLHSHSCFPNNVTFDPNPHICHPTTLRPSWWPGSEWCHALSASMVPFPTSDVQSGVRFGGPNTILRSCFPFILFQDLSGSALCPTSSLVGFTSLFSRFYGRIQWSSGPHGWRTEMKETWSKSSTWLGSNLPLEKAPLVVIGCVSFRAAYVSSFHLLSLLLPTTVTTR